MLIEKPNKTDNHATIKDWVLKHQGVPALAEGIVPDGKAGEMLRIDFLDNSEGQLYEITWKQFFDIFERHNLEFHYRDGIMEGARKPYYKFIRKGQIGND